MKLSTSTKNKMRVSFFFIFFVVMTAGNALGVAPSGYSEYYIPGDEESMNFILDEISPFDTLGDGTPDYLDIMHCIISVTAWSENTTLYYDHWEDGYDFDPDDLSTADETYTFGTAGANRTFESSYMPAAPRNSANEYYDGTDRLYVAGGTVTVTRTSWNDTNPDDYPGHTIASTLLAVAWEIYPVRPQLIKYILPFGEDLALSAANGGQDLMDFDRVFALIQATEDNTTLQVDFNKDGTFDSLDWDRDGTVDGTSTTLSQGEVFLLDRLSIGDQAITYPGAIPDATANSSTADNLLIAGAEILGSETLQVHYVIGDEGSTYEIRGLTAFPRGLWDDEYYAQVDGPTTATDDPVDLYLYNPQSTTLDISYETTSGTGTFTIAAETTRSFNEATGSYMPENTAVYLKGSDVFWGVSTIDTEDTGNDWAYSLVPASLLEQEHYIGWAPGSYPVGASAGTDDPDSDSKSDSGIYLTPARDNTTIFIDYKGDGFRTADGDTSYTLDRLESQYVYDSSDGDMSNANIYATGPYSAAYGQNPDTAPPGSPAIDVGYTTIPGVDFIDLVLTVDKTVSPGVISTASGSSTTFTLMVQSHDYPVTGISIIDTLPENWDYDNASDSTTITLADMTQVTTDPAETTNGDGDKVLTWSSSVLGSMAPNQEIIIEFTARTTAAFSVGDFSRNDVTAVGTRTVQTVTQTFTATDFTFVGYKDSDNDFTMSKASDAVDPLSPGDQYTYTVTMNNTGDDTLTGISIYDELPDGIEYVASSSKVSFSMIFQDTFPGVSYSNQADNSSGITWDSNWIENNDSGTAQSPSDGNIRILNDVSDYQLRVQGQSVEIARAADLSAYSEATLSFDYRRDSLDDADESVSCQVCQNASVSGSSSTVTVDASSEGASSSATSITISHTTGTGSDRLMLVGVSQQRNSDTVTGITYNGVALTQVTYTGISADDRTEVWYLLDSDLPSDGAAHNVVVSLSANSLGTVAGVVTFTGVDQSSPLGTSMFATGRRTTDGNPTVTVTSETNGMVFDTLEVRDDDDDVTLTLGSGQTTQWGPSRAGSRTRGTGSTKAGAASVTMSYSISDGDGDNNRWAILAVPVSPATVSSITCPAGWTNVDTFAGAATDTGYTSVSYDLNDAAYLNGNANDADFALRFVSSSDTESDDTVYFDNVKIKVGSTTPVAAGDPPNFVSSSDSVDLNAGESLTLTFDVTVDDPLATGIEEITNTADVLTAEIPIPKSDTVTNLVNNPSASTGEVGDLVWLDTDGDGIKDVGENGLANVEVTLKDEFGTPLATLLTDSSGRYRFTGITPGDDYYVEVTGGLPAGLEQSAPSGHSDDKTGLFDLSSGDVYLDADLGYTAASNTGIIGDIVWNDADGDGNQDGGELGLSGVTVQLWEDTNGTAGFQFGTGAGDDTLIDTQDTGADGSYLFAGVPASGSEDYFVFVDGSQAALSGYTNTTPISTQEDDLADGDSRLTNDFGFQSSGTTYSYKDRVWFDADEDEDDDSGVNDNGESGISGVTVDLLDASLNVIASVTTDTDGYFEFTGVAGGGADYTVRITDNNSKLTDYYGTTAEAIAGEMAINNLNGNLDYTVEPTEPNFGFNVRGAIGDTVFNDVNGDGDQDAGELGISGVTVRLYDDADEDGLLDAGESVLATVDTDANGNYIFSGLDDGFYIVSIDTTPSNYTYTTESPDDDSATGEQQDVEISSGDTHLDLDFGYEANTQGSISGTLWEDDDEDGVIDGGEAGLSGVTIVLQDSGGSSLATTTTDANGDYSFTGIALPASGNVDFKIVITDDSGVLSSYDTTYEDSEGITGPFNGEETLTLSAGSPSQSDIDFGFKKPPVVTRAVVGDFGAFNEGGKVVVRWQTVSEHGTVGFYLYRLDAKTGQYKAVNTRLLPGLLHSPAGGSYSYEDKNAKINTDYTYRLEEVEVSGNRITYGPWQVYTGTQFSGGQAVTKLDAHVSINGYKSAKKPLSDAKTARLTSKMEASLSAYAEKRARKGECAKIYVEEDGLCFIDAEDIATVLDTSLKEITSQIKFNNVRLRCMGRKVAVLPVADNCGVYFYGEKCETRYSDENVYWLDIHKGLKMKTVDRAPKTPSADLQYFYQWVWEEESNYPMTALFSDPADDFWMWDFVFPGFVDNVALSVSTPGIMDVEDATISVALQGATDAFAGNDHHAVIRVNGQEVGETIWDGFNSTVISVPVAAAILNDGDNIVEVVGINDPDVEFNYFYVNNLQIVYPRSYSSVDNQLTAENNGYKTIRMDGFTDADIRVFDITDLRRPKVLAKTVIEPSASGNGVFQVSFNAGTVLRRYLALTPDMIKSCTLIADQPSYLKKRFNLGDFLVITRSDMVSAAQTLADYRASQGLHTMVVDVEDIYDEFSYGIRDADAIREFLAWAYSKWRIPPKYVLLAGDGSFDYKGYKGFGDSIIPALLSSIPDDGMRVTDLPYSDVSGNDWIPEFALGRIPVISEDELLDYINKVIGYESSSGAWTSQAVLAADDPDTGGDFISSSEEVAGLFPGDFLLDKLYMDVMPMSTARTNFVADINDGRAYVNFIGHGTMFQIGNKNLFSTADLSNLNNSMMLPVVTAMTCVAGDFGYPGYDALNEELVLKANGGAIAMWAPSGFAFNSQSVELCKGFYNAVFIGGETVLGDAIRRAQERFAGQGEKLYHLELYNLIGDPALRLK